MHIDNDSQTYCYSGFCATRHKSLPQRCKSRRASEPRRQGCRRSRLLQTLGNAGYEVLRLSRRVKKMACNRPNPQVHHWFIPHKVLQYVVDSIFTRGSQLLAIFFMQLGGQPSPLRCRTCPCAQAPCASVRLYKEYSFSDRNRRFQTGTVSWTDSNGR
jgi:hypothetical protein